MKLELKPVSLFFLFLVFLNALTCFGQISDGDRDNALGMLDSLKDTIKKNYYDPNYHGVNLEDVFTQAKQKIKTAGTRDELMMTLAQATLSLDDSHTVFIPPSRAAEIDYGWQVSMIGNECFVVGVKPGSDAEAKGLKPGDKVFTIDGYTPSKNNLWKMYYRYYAIMPAQSVRLIVQSPNETKPRAVDVATKIEKTAKMIDYLTLYSRIIRKGWDVGEDRYFEFDKDLFVWKMSTFNVRDQHIDTMMGKAKNYKSLIIDLRDNSGGAVSALKRLTGYFFDKEIKIADEKSRKETKPLLAKSRGKDVFTGNLIVLINNNSASASEVFARIIQINNRGKVIGDRSSGSVMESRFEDMQVGISSILYFGANVTIADLIMSDGKSLEKVGVSPDVSMLATGVDLATQKDPVLSFAAKQSGVDISPEKAGTMFPIKWGK